MSASSTCLTDYSLHLIGMCCKKLVHLDLSRVAVTPQSLKLMTQHCNALKTLIIRGCHSVGEKSLWWALHHCREMEKLDVSQNRRLNGQCFYMSVSTLQTVSLRDCSSMTDGGIALLAEHSPNLRSLNISKCNRLSGKCLHSLAKVGLGSYHKGYCKPYKATDLIFEVKHDVGFSSCVTAVWHSASGCSGALPSVESCSQCSCK